jgi:KDO2-lipid IV(A) lauroyltransferase
MGAFVKAVLVCASFLLSLLPMPLFLALGRGIGALLRLSGFRRATIEQNLQLAFPDWTAQKRQDLLNKNYQHYGLLVVEFIRYFYGFQDFLKRYSRVEGAEHLHNAVAQGQGIFCVGLHLGNWELFAAATNQVVPSTMVTKRLKPEWLHDLIVQSRAKLGIGMAFEPKTLKVVMKTLKEGKLVGFVMDQYTGAPVGARVPFFGVPVGSHTALAALALRTRAPVVPGYVHRLADGSHCIRFEPALELLEVPDNLEQSVLLNTANYVRCTERWIREFPEQWLWIHKRWKGDLSALPANAIGELLK